MKLNLFRKKTMALAISVSMLASLCTGAVMTSAASAEPLYTQNFENGSDNITWDPWGDNPAVGAIVSGGYRSDHSFKIEGGWKNGAIKHITGEFEVGKAYQLSYYVKGGLFRTDLKGISGETISGTAKEYPSCDRTPTWTRQILRFTAPEGLTEVDLMLFAGTSDIYVDNIVLSEADDTLENYVMNGSFDESAQAWSTDLNPTAIYQATGGTDNGGCVKLDVKNDNASYFDSIRQTIGGSENKTEGQVTTRHNGFVKGNKYTMTFMSKGNASFFVRRIALGSLVVDGTAVDNTSTEVFHDLPNTTDWTKHNISFEFSGEETVDDVTTQLNTLDIRLYPHGDKNVASAWFDDVSVTDYVQPAVVETETPAASETETPAAAATPIININFASAEGQAAYTNWGGDFTAEGYVVSEDNGGAVNAQIPVSYAGKTLDLNVRVKQTLLAQDGVSTKPEEPTDVQNMLSQGMMIKIHGKAEGDKNFEPALADRVYLTNTLFNGSTDFVDLKLTIKVPSVEECGFTPDYFKMELWNSSKATYVIESIALEEQAEVSTPTPDVTATPTATATTTTTTTTVTKSYTAYIPVTKVSIAKVAGTTKTAAKVNVYKKAATNKGKWITVAKNKKITVKSVKGQYAKVTVKVKGKKRTGYVKVTGLKFGKTQKGKVISNTKAYKKASTKNGYYMAFNKNKTFTINSRYKGYYRTTVKVTTKKTIVITIPAPVPTAAPEATPTAEATPTTEVTNEPEATAIPEVTPTTEVPEVPEV